MKSPPLVYLPPSCCVKLCPLPAPALPGSSAVTEWTRAVQHVSGLLQVCRALHIIDIMGTEYEEFNVYAQNQSTVNVLSARQLPGNIRLAAYFTQQLPHQHCKSGVPGECFSLQCTHEVTAVWGGLFGAVSVLILHTHTDISEKAKGSHCSEDNSFGHHLLWVASTEEVVLGVCSRCIVMWVTCGRAQTSFYSLWLGTV